MCNMKLLCDECKQKGVCYRRDLETDDIVDGCCTYGRNQKEDKKIRKQINNGEKKFVCTHEYEKRCPF